MKKYLLFLFLLLVMSAGILCAGHCRLNSVRDKVVITETVCQGNPAAAADITIAYHTQSFQNHFQWETSFTPGSAEQAETDFQFTAAASKELFVFENYVDFSCVHDGVGISRGNVMENQYIKPFLLPVQDIASRTPAGEGRTETVRMADYYEYYPLFLSASCHDRGGYLSDTVYSYENGWMNRYFHLKMEKENVCQITIEKDSGGSVISVDIRPDEEARAGYLWDEGIATADGIYLIAESYDANGRPDGRLECPDGLGIHFIPAQDEEKLAESEWFDMSGLRLFYSTGSAETLRLTLSPDKTKLRLYTREAGQLVLTIIDIASEQALQRLELMKLPDGKFTLFEQNELSLAVQDTGDFCLVVENAGEYVHVLSGSMDFQEDLRLSLKNLLGRQWPSSVPAAMAWDGERMVVAAENDYSYGFFDENSCDIIAGVWDADGLLYLGTYAHSVRRDPAARRRSGSLFGYDSAPLRIAFAGAQDGQISAGFYK